MTDPGLSTHPSTEAVGERCGDKHPLVGWRGVLICTNPAGHDAHRDAERDPGTVWVHRDERELMIVPAPNVRWPAVDGFLAGLLRKQGWLSPTEVEKLRTELDDIAAKLELANLLLVDVTAEREAARAEVERLRVELDSERKRVLALLADLRQARAERAAIALERDELLSEPDLHRVRSEDG